MAEWIAADAGLPGARRLPACALLSLRHLAGDADAEAALRGAGFAGLALPGRFAGEDPCLVWRNPTEQLVLATRPDAITALRDALAPGRSPLAAAFALDEEALLVELHGPCLDHWLARLVDAAAIPRERGQARRCRFVDVPVVLLRQAPQRAWLLTEWPLADYLQAWLRHAHEALAAER